MVLWLRVLWNLSAHGYVLTQSGEIRGFLCVPQLSEALGEVESAWGTVTPMHSPLLSHVAPFRVLGNHSTCVRWVSNKDRARRWPGYEEHQRRVGKPSRMCPQNVADHPGDTARKSLLTSVLQGVLATKISWLCLVLAKNMFWKGSTVLFIYPEEIQVSFA